MSNRFPQHVMKNLFCICIAFFTLCSVKPAIAQKGFQGVWTYQKNVSPGFAATLILQVDAPQNDVLHPALLTINYKNYTGNYSFLLFKHAANAAAIGRQKYVEEENGFAPENWMVFLNGDMQLQNKNGKMQLQVQRLFAKRYGVVMRSVSSYNEGEMEVAQAIFDILRSDDLQFQYSRPYTMPQNLRNKILSIAPAKYYGIRELPLVHKSNAIFTLTDNLRSDVDSVFVQLNGETIIAPVGSTGLDAPVIAKLKPGRNLVTFFAVNYGAVPPNTGKLILTVDGRQELLDFTESKNVSATAMAAFINYQPGNNATANTTEEKFDSALLRKVVLAGQITTGFKEVTLALWDDSVEDGDSISLNINGSWVVKNMRVTRQPQFIKTTLKAGNNLVIFVADNLGGIPPNTAMLEIIDEKKRKSFPISTDLKQNSLIKINYEVKD